MVSLISRETLTRATGELPALFCLRRFFEFATPPVFAGFFAIITNFPKAVVPALFASRGCKNVLYMTNTQTRSSSDIATKKIFLSGVSEPGENPVFKL